MFGGGGKDPWRCPHGNEQRATAQQKAIAFKVKCVSCAYDYESITRLRVRLAFRRLVPDGNDSVVPPAIRFWFIFLGVVVAIGPPRLSCGGG